PAALEERQLLEVLLAEPGLVARARAALPAAEIAHLGLRRLVEGLYALDAAGRPATLDELRADLDHTALLNKAFELQSRGLDQPNREQCLLDLLAHFQRRREKALKQQLHLQLRAAEAAHDEQAVRELLQRIQNRSVDPGPEAATREET